MTTRNALAAIGGFFDIFGSAVAVSRAVEARTGSLAPAICARSASIPSSFRKISRR